MIMFACPVPIAGYYTIYFLHAIECFHNHSWHCSLTGKIRIADAFLNASMPTHAHTRCQWISILLYTTTTTTTTIMTMMMIVVVVIQFRRLGLWQMTHREEWVCW